MILGSYSFPVCLFQPRLDNYNSHSSISQLSFFIIIFGGEKLKVIYTFINSKYFHFTLMR